MCSLFDLNRDGKVDGVERAMALKLLAEMEEMEAYIEQSDAELRSQAEARTSVLRGELEQLEDSDLRLHEELIALNDELSLTNGNEPEDTSSAYERWKQRQALLEQQIETVEDLLEDVTQRREDGERELREITQRFGR